MNPFSPRDGWRSDGSSLEQNSLNNEFSRGKCSIGKCVECGAHTHIIIKCQVPLGIDQSPWSHSRHYVLKSLLFHFIEFVLKSVLILWREWPIFKFSINLFVENWTTASTLDIWLTFPSLARWLMLPPPKHLKIEFKSNTWNNFVSLHKKNRKFMTLRLCGRDPCAVPFAYGRGEWRVTLKSC